MLIEHGEARTYFDTYEVVIVRSHPRVVRMELMTGLIDHVNHILNQFANDTKYSDKLTLVFKERLANIQKAGHPLVKRWAPLEPLGEVAGSLFGLATTDDLEETRERINGVISAMHGQTTVIREMTIAINDTLRNQDAMQNTIHSLTQQAKLARGLLNYLQATEIPRLRGFQFVETVLSMMEFYKGQEVAFEA
jgi:hypothetical protein